MLERTVGIDGRCPQPPQEEDEEGSVLAGFEVCLLLEQRRLDVLVIQALEQLSGLRLKRGKETAQLTRVRQLFGHQHHRFAIQGPMLASYGAQSEAINRSLRRIHESRLQVRNAYKVSIARSSGR